MISDPRKFVRTWLTKHGVTIDERGGLQSGDNRDNTEIFDTMFLDYCEQVSYFNYKADKKIKAVPETHLLKALNELISLHIMEERKKLFSKIQFQGAESFSQLEKLVIATCGEANSTVVGVLAHFLWGIKRRLMGQDVLFNIMPILLGKQGAGKSVFVENLLRPIQNLTLEINLSDVVDPRYHLSFSKNFAIIINEMAGANKTDVEKLKNLITAKNNDVRKLHTNTVTKVKQNASLIGTTNKPVAEIIYDPSGARRFYEIKTLDLMDWKTINEVDYVQLWQGINEGRARGYYEEHQSDIVRDQENLVGLEELQVFLDLYKVKPGTKEISGLILYDAYKLWCEANGVKNPFNSVWFSRRLTGKGFKKPYQKSVRGKTTQIYCISEEAIELHGKTSYDPLAAKDYQ
jgi:hypothetical protein